MWTKKSKKQIQDTRLRNYDRLMLRSAFVSLFWNAIMERQQRGKFTLSELARRVGTNKSAVSRWFSAAPRPNWTLDSISDIAGALDLDLRIEAIDRATGATVSAEGVRPRVPVHNTQDDKTTTMTDSRGFYRQESGTPLQVSVG